MFWTKLGNFSSYFNRLLTLDTGARVWTDPADWFWGLHRWLRLLGETVLIAYIGTISGMIVAFAGVLPGQPQPGALRRAAHGRAPRAGSSAARCPTSSSR